MINYLRNKDDYTPVFESKNEEDLFSRELSFWGIKGHAFGHQLVEDKFCEKFSKRLVDLMKSPP